MYSGYGSGLRTQPLGVTGVEGDGGGGGAAYFNHLRSAFEGMMDPLRAGQRPSLV